MEKRRKTTVEHYYRDVSDQISRISAWSLTFPCNKMLMSTLLWNFMSYLSFWTFFCLMSSYYIVFTIPPTLDSYTVTDIPEICIKHFSVQPGILSSFYTPRTGGSSLGRRGQESRGSVFGKSPDAEAESGQSLPYLSLCYCLAASVTTKKALFWTVQQDQQIQDGKKEGAADARERERKTVAQRD